MRILNSILLRKLRLPVLLFAVLVSGVKAQEVDATKSLFEAWRWVDPLSGG